MKNICFYLLLLSILPLLSASAQVVSTVNGYPVIDLSALKPLGAVLTYPEAVARRTEMYADSVKPSRDELLSVGPAISCENGSWNAKMSTRFQVMRADGAGGNKLSWEKAWAKCKSYNGEGGGATMWRLPTLSELEMIYILHPQLIGKGGFIPFSVDDSYWSSTESSTKNAWYLYINHGLSVGSLKFFAIYFRCIRDL